MLGKIEKVRVLRNDRREGNPKKKKKKATPIDPLWPAVFHLFVT